MHYENIQDSELIERIKQTNDPYWFGILYDRYVKKVYNKSLGFLKDQQDAEDLTHDIFLKVFISLKQFQGKSLFSTWLFAITYNFCISFLRKKKILEPLTENIELSEEKEIDESEFLSIRASQLEKALDEILPEEKIILLMKYQDGMSIKDIQDIFQLGESAVKMRLKRAKNKVMELCSMNIMNNKTF
jgi:RNA polymerase sigma-70 factor (ECF subfamily)